jgi:16S rRNA (adenine1518-N6/adenine1519-N6)-dimethyltransferase
MRRRLGQVYLQDPNILRKILDTSSVDDGDRILEIGPGKGVLTEALLERGARVLAFEVDRRLAEALGTRFVREHGRSLFLLVEDYLKADIEARARESYLAPPLKVVSNIPFYITTPILEKLVRERTLYSRVHLTVQREVAERLLASPGTHEYGSLTLFIAYHFDPRLDFIISRNCFRPVPRVDSAFVTLTPHTHAPVHVRSKERLFTVIRAAFSFRRKKLRTALRLALGALPFEDIEARSGIDLDRRGETLSLEEFGVLSNATGES